MTEPKIVLSEERVKNILYENNDLLLSKLEEKLEKKADIVMLDDARHDIRDLRLDVDLLKVWRAGQDGSSTTREKISARSLVLWGLALTAFVGVLSAVATLVWLAAGG